MIRRFNIFIICFGFLIWANGFFTVTVPEAIADDFQVNTYTTGSQDNPSVAMDANGNFVITWQSMGQDGDGYGIFAQRFDSFGNAIGSEFQINTYTTSDQENPSVTMDASGNFVVTWQSMGQDGDGYGIYAQRYDGFGNPAGSEFQVNAYTIGDQENPSVAVDASGNFVIAWKHDGVDENSDTENRVYAYRYDSLGNPVGSELEANLSNLDIVYGPSLAMDSNGNLVIVWCVYASGTSPRNKHNYINAQRFDSSGNAVDSQFEVYGNYAAAGLSSVAMDSNGNSVITWTGYNFQLGNLDVLAQRYDSFDNAVGSEFQVNTYSTNNQGNSSVAIDSNGNFIIAWESVGQDGDNGGIYAQWYNSLGNTIGSEFQINTYTTLSQSLPSVAMDSNDNYVIAWQSDGQDGDSNGIFMKLYITDDDYDGDGILNHIDNCPDIQNTDQANYDGDFSGDVCDPDDDNDGMPDDYEMVQGYNPYDPLDATYDPDSDGLTNLEEYNSGTDPQNSDTDGDGVVDGFDGHPLDDQQSSCIELVQNVYNGFTTVQSAIDHFTTYDYDTVMITAEDFYEDIIYNRDIYITLSGGYYCSFSDNPSVSSINSLIISNGTVNLENIVIRTPSCDNSDILLCITQSDCTAAGGYWWSNNTCLGLPESETVISTMQKVWMDRNLGASRLAIGTTDDEAYGDLYQWGRGADGHQLLTSATTSTTSSTDDPGHADFITTGTLPFDWRIPQNDSLWQGVSGTNNPCPAGFRLPTVTEWETERLSWISNDAAGAFASALKLVTAGFRYPDGSIDHPDCGYYASSTVDGSSTRYLTFSETIAFLSWTDRVYGMSVRCIKD